MRSDRKTIMTAVGTVFQKKCGLQFLDIVETNATKVRILGRQPNQRVGDFVRVVESILVAAEEAPWKVDISRTYFLKGGSVVQAVRLIFDIPADTDLEDIQAQLVQAIVSTRLAGAEADADVPLPWTGTVDNGKGKGAGPQGTLPAILRRRT